MATVMSAKLASCSEDIKIWDSLSYVVAHRFSPYSSSIRNLNWSPDLSHLVSVPKNGEVVKTTYIKNSKADSIDINLGIVHTYARFANNNPQILGIGGNNGTVHVWNLKIQKSKSVFTKHTNEITCLQFNWNDSYIASASSNGNIILHNVLKNEEHALYSSPRPECINALQFSYVKKSVLGAVSASGSLSLWDINESKLLYSFKQSHTSPATGIAFSPVNHLLVASVGLDKRLICYDPQLRSCIKTYRTEAPLTAIDFMNDGITLAVGSVKGKIYIYDLRSSSTPMKTLSAHSNSINSLSFQHSSYSLSNKSLGPTKKSAQLCKDKELFASNDINMNQKAVLRNKDINCNLSPKVLDKSSENSLEVTDNSTIPTSSSLKLDSVFSPIGCHENSESTINIRRQPIGGGNNTSTTSNYSESNVLQSPKFLSTELTLPSLLKNFHPSPSSQEIEQCLLRQACNIDNSQESVSNSDGLASLSLKEKSSHASNIHNSGTRHIETLGAWTDSNENSIPKSLSNQDNLKSVTLEDHSNNQIFQNVTNDKVENELNMNENGHKIDLDSSITKEGHNVISNSIKDLIKTTVHNTFKEEIHLIVQNTFKEQMQQEIQQLLRNCVRQVVDDSVVDLHDTLRREHNQLQFEMIRQFQIQLIEIQELLKQTLVNEQHLIAEVERLREENEKLKMVY
ncbi:protein NEDD1-like isoform X2 [Centruroides vittatus]